MAVKPADIVEQQLQRLQELSEKGLLTFDETKALESLIKLQIILRFKAAGSKDRGEELSEMSTEELKETIKLLENFK